MCIMARPVRSVSNTRIFVGCDSRRERQLLVYEMAVELQGGSNAMILPVPAAVPEDVALLDLSEAPQFFDDLDKPFERMTLGTKGGSRGFGDTLKIHEVGNYRVSIAPSVEDLDRVDPAVFTLSAETRQTLTPNYGTGFVFVVAALRESGKFHPLAYTHPVMEDGRLFIPTRHEHGNSTRHGYAALPRWDHYVYRQVPTVFAEMPGSKDHTEIRGKGSRDDPYPRVATCIEGLVAKVPTLAPFLDADKDGARLFRTAFKGPLKNMDLHLERPRSERWTA